MRWHAFLPSSPSFIPSSPFKRAAAKWGIPARFNWMHLNAAAAPLTFRPQTLKTKRGFCYTMKPLPSLLNVSLIPACQAEKLEYQRRELQGQAAKQIHFFYRGMIICKLKKKLNCYEFNQILFLQFSRNHEISSRSQGTEWKNNKSTRLILLPVVTSHWMLPLKGQTNLKFTTPLNKCACSFKSPNSALFQKFYL